MTDPDIPLSSSGTSAVSESTWLSARPVQISCCRTASAMGITMAVVDVLLSHMERNTVQHMKPSTNLHKKEVILYFCVCVCGGGHIMTTFTIIIVFKCTKVWCSHARLGPCNHHHPQSNPFMKVPLLYGGRQANDSHQQQSCVFAVLCCYLNTHRGTKIITSNDKSTSFQTNSTDAGKINKMRCCRQEEVPRPSFHPVHPPSYRISTYGLLFLICSTSHQQRSQVCKCTHLSPKIF